ncbi:MAG: UDP-N-acetylglucosamine--N-acetylmuramyl-(pentapeptide) pyrophosphoryl-undecaprenol N-acetylglucosamine transferase, partial [Actinomycetota bacterium]|nr:UDP-N-acetylglucosamine--N-acetylmuramyl-(pentapeptide) pyrophosphoryl-undecaprenol N-acetylglucosamine transferase [Actinomycetota bacterium]
LLARFARAAAVSFSGTPLPRAVVTGNPVRQEIGGRPSAAERATARAALDAPADRHLLLVTGGSLGALRINRAVLQALPLWRDRQDLAIHHVVGRRDWAAITADTPADLGDLQYRAVEYEDDMPTALRAADLAVCRSGSGTCFELGAVGLPAVLVPSPVVTADQQTRNARHLVDAGAAALVPDAELDGPRLVAEVDALVADPARLEAMRAAAGSWAPDDAAGAVADLVEAHARG